MTSSVVNKSVPKNAIVVRVPARIIGYTIDFYYDVMKGEAWGESSRPYLENKR